MYTAEQARTKIESETSKFEAYLDDFLKTNFQGTELCVPVSFWTESIICGVLDKYKQNGWDVRPQNINPGTSTGSVYFSLPTKIPQAKS